MHRKLIHGFLAFSLVFVQAFNLGHLRSVKAASTPASETVIATDDLTVTVAGEKDADQTAWTVAYTRKANPTPRALRLNVTTGDRVLSPVEEDFEEVTRSGDTWWREAALSAASTGELHFTTASDQTTLTVTAQLDSAEADDLLDSKVAGPHTVTLPATAEPAEADSETAAEPAAEAEAETVTPATTPTTASQTPVAPTAQAQYEAVIVPETTTVAATGLYLTLAARANILLNVEDGQGNWLNGVSTYTKGLDRKEKYGSREQMEKATSTDYVEDRASYSRAVIFDTVEEAAEATIKLSFDDVGYVRAKSGQLVAIGAYVEVSNLTHRNVEWDNRQNMGIDWSNNFYSGISIANVRHFDWDVTFFTKDDHHTIAFEPGDAQLTFTSLNPGEFVASQDDLTVSVADAASVQNTWLREGQTVPDNYTDFAKFKQANWQPAPSSGDIQAYTAHKWGNWNVEDPALINTDIEWQDKLGMPSFGNGAAGFFLVGTTFKFTRGTYSQGNSTWLANASGAADLIIPELTNNKTITADPDQGGGTAAMVQAAEAAGNFFTTNELDGKTVNTQATTGAPLYYFINQETYTVIEDAVSRPNEIVIEDLLPYGVVPYANLEADLTVINERRTTGDYQTLASTSTLEPETVDGKTRYRLTVRIKSTAIKDMPFAGGFFSVRLRVKVGVDMATLREQLAMPNTASVAMYDTTNAERWQQETNTVTIYVAPDRVSVNFTKVNDLGTALAGAQFGLFDTETAKEARYTSNVSDTTGNIRFTQVVPGVYWLKEVRTPAGYQTLKTPVKVTVTTAGKIEWPADWAVADQVVNQPLPFGIGVIKTDTGSPAEQLAGAEFGLYQDGEELAVGITPKSGTLDFAGLELKPGQYTLRELSAPPGFTKLAGTFTFTLNRDGTLSDVSYDGSDLAAKHYHFALHERTLAITIANHRGPGSLPITGGPGRGAYWAVGATLAGLALLWWRRKKAVSA